MVASTWPLDRPGTGCSVSAPTDGSERLGSMASCSFSVSAFERITSSVTLTGVPGSFASAERIADEYKPDADWQAVDGDDLVEY